MADAARYGVPWARRLQGQDMLDQALFEHQMAAAGCALGRPARPSQLKARPQRAPLHTRYPAHAAARACLGLTAAVEFDAHQSGLGAGWVRGLAAMPVPPDVDQRAHQLVQGQVMAIVNQRVAGDHLHRFGGLTAIVSHRLYMAAIGDQRLRQLRDVVAWACLHGELIPGILARPCIVAAHDPLAIQILEALRPACERYCRAAATCSAPQLIEHGRWLAAELMSALLPFLPRSAPSSQSPQAPPIPPVQPGRPRLTRRVRMRSAPHPPPPAEAMNVPVQGCEELLPPVIDVAQPQPAPRAPAPQDAERLSRTGAPSAEASALRALMAGVGQAIAAATGRASFEDPRVDEVTQALRAQPLRPGLLDDPARRAGYRLLAYGTAPGGAIQEEALPPCRDPQRLDRIARASEQVEKRIGRLGWFGHRRKARPRRYCTQGALDRRALGRLACSQAVRRQWEHTEVVDARGSPVVVLAKDGSSSNTLQTTFAGQVLAHAFLRLAPRVRIRVFAADYASGPGPLVRWLYHPTRTPGRTTRAATAAVASLPPKGQGANADVLSISHIVRQVVAAPGVHAATTIILVNITDGKFNSPPQQVRAMVQALRREHGLSYSFVVLGDVMIDVPEADHVVTIPGRDLGNARIIAERIAAHVRALVAGLRGKAGRRRGRNDRTATRRRGARLAPMGPAAPDPLGAA